MNGGWHYRAPLDEMRFVMDRVLGAPTSWRACGAFAELDIDTADAVLDQAARFASEVLQPLNAGGDQQGCRRDEHGRVRTPDGFKAAYQAFVDAGWPALPCSPDWGGQGLPLLLDAAMREMLDACNHGWTMYPDLLHGAYETLKAHASDALKDRYLAKIVSGEWLAAMALTEAHAGSDLGLLRTRADPQPDGSLRVHGNKIFISGGDHDLTDNIVHLVLARLPDAPPGTRGITLVLVPSVLPDGSRNHLACDGLEEKMGLHGSATCSMRYEGAVGWRVGEPHRGLAAMFLMMNSARLHVGLQGLGHQEMVTQNALRYAFDRRQGRSGHALPAGESAAPIAEHPAMRHTLLTLQVWTEAQRVIAYRAALALDESAHHDDADRRKTQSQLAALLTPIVKAWCTDRGFVAASAALQVHGGYGYVRDTGVEQALRDVRIAMIYEGTNEIQAIDLVQRKLLADGGSALALLLAEFSEEAARAEALPGLGDFSSALRAHIALATRGIASLRERSQDDSALPLRVAGEVMAGLAHTLLAWALTATARALGEVTNTNTNTDTNTDNNSNHNTQRPIVASASSAARLQRLRYGLQWLLPQGEVHWQRVLASDADLPELQSA